MGGGYSAEIGILKKIGEQTRARARARGEYILRGINIFQVGDLFCFAGVTFFGA